MGANQNSLPAADMDADALALSNAIVRSMVTDPEGRVAKELIESIVKDMTRELPDDVDEIIQELGQRSIRPAIIVGMLAQMVAEVIRGAEEAGIDVNLDALSSPYDVLATLEDPLPEDE